MEREALIDSTWLGRREALWECLDGEIARDDLNDSLAAHWTARRTVNGTAVQMPAVLQRDVEGLAIRIVS